MISVLLSPSLVRRCTFGVTDAEIAAAREGTSPDPAVAAMIAISLAIYSNPTTITDDQVAELHAFG